MLGYRSFAGRSFTGRRWGQGEGPLDARAAIAASSDLERSAEAREERIGQTDTESKRRLALHGGDVGDAQLGTGSTTRDGAFAVDLQ